MAGTDAGVIYAEIRVQLDKLRNDINQVTAQFNRVPGEATKTTQQTNSAFASLGEGVTKSLKGLSQTAVGQFATMAKGIQGALNAVPIIAMISMVVGAVTKLTSGVAKWLKDSSEAYRAHQAEVGKLNALLQTTGAIAWTSTKELEAMALELSHATKTEQDDIMKMQGVLLGFRSITGETFERTTKAIIDMAAVMGGDLASSANVVGKAIDTPVQGMTALSRQGFVFTQAEKDMVKQLEETGHHLEAQKVIIDALEGAFAGAAKAINSASEQQNRLKNAQEELKRAQGEATSGIAAWWAKARANWTEARLAAQVARNEMEKASKNIASGYNEQEEAITRVKERLAELKAEGADANELLQMENLSVKMDLDLDLEKATDQLAAAKKAAKDYYAAARAGGERVTEENNKTYAALLETVRAEEANVAKKKETLEVQKKLYADTAATLALISAENDQVAEQDKATEDILAKQAATLREIERLRQAELITEEEANKQRAAAYETTAKNMITVQGITERLSLTQEASLSAQNALQERQNRLIDEAAEAMRRYNVERNSGSAQMTGKEFSNERVRIVEEFNNAIKHNNNLLNAGIIVQEEYDRRYLQAKQNEVTALDQLIKKAHAAQDGNENTYNAALEAAEELRKLNEEALTLASNEQLADQMDTWKNKMLELGASTEQLRGMEYARMQAEITGSQASNEVKQQALAQLNELYNATSKLQQEQRDEKGLKKYNEMDQALKNMTSSSKELLEIQRRQAIESVQSMGLSLDMEEKLLEKTNEYYDTLQKKQAWDTFKNNAMSVMNEVMNIFNAAVQLMDTLNRNQASQQILELDAEYEPLLKSLEEADQAQKEYYDKEIKREKEFIKDVRKMEDKAFNEKYERLDEALQKERERKLFEQGLSEAQSVEDYQAELERAYTTLNEKNILEAQMNLERALINQQFDEEQKVLEEQKQAEQDLIQAQRDEHDRAREEAIAAQKLSREQQYNDQYAALEKEYLNKKAQAEYQAAMTSWNLQKVQAVASMAQAAIITLASTPWPISAALAALASGAAAIQLGIIQSNKPVLQKYAEGGIVPGSSFSGDNVLARVNSGERILNTNQQNTIDDALSGKLGGGESTITIIVPLHLNSKILAEAVAEYVNSKGAMIEQRAIR
jgi:hypothetical protein